MSKKRNNNTQAYMVAKAAKVGEVVKCACCGDSFIKRQYSQAFCCGMCKDSYWNRKGDRHKKGYYKQYNIEHPERLERIGISLDDDELRFEDGWLGMRDEDFDYCDW